MSTLFLLVDTDFSVSRNHFHFPSSGNRFLLFMTNFVLVEFLTKCIVTNVMQCKCNVTNFYNKTLLLLLKANFLVNPFDTSVLLCLSQVNFEKKPIISDFYEKFNTT